MTKRGRLGPRDMRHRVRTALACAGLLVVASAGCLVQGPAAGDALATTTSTTSASSTATSGTFTLGPGPLEAPVLPPVLEITASAPASARKGGTFTVAFAVSLEKKGGPAYHAPAFGAVLPLQARPSLQAAFAGARSTSDWVCSFAGHKTLLTCSWRGRLPLKAGTSLGEVRAVVDVPEGAPGELTARASLKDVPDAAEPVVASARVLLSAVAVLSGYRLVTTAGAVFSFGDATPDGSCQQPDKPCGVTTSLDVRGIAALPAANGYWLVARDGAVFGFGKAHYFGSCTTQRRACGPHPGVVGIAASPGGGGYWLVTGAGTVFAFGSSHNYGSCSSKRACRFSKLVGIAPTPDGKGYWLAASSGAVFSFGDAKKFSSCTTSGPHCGELLGGVTAITASSKGQGYWLVDRSGRVFAFGDAEFLGDAYTARGTRRSSSPVVGITSMASGAGYWTVASDGVVFAFKGARFMGDIYDSKAKLAYPVTGMASS